ncbi:MAG: tRNA (cytidine(34)-2'-O)-methyltransferase [Deltaproteobacteria bacterium]|nr:tRNA (cytidine(34)-2'-O)-methyltransferase [Deltaproteobacteria bacterium]
MPFNVALIHPQIPSNTGNIGRLCVATSTALHLVEPFGFDISDKQLKRAGLDYWPHLSCTTHKNIAALFTSMAKCPFVMLSSNTGRPLWDHEFTESEFLLFGCEQWGLPSDLMDMYSDHCLTIPQYSDNVRCLNLANAVAITLYEALRQTRCTPATGQTP